MNKKEKKKALSMAVEYFKKHKIPKTRAAGLAVILGGIPTTRIGLLDCIVKDSDVVEYYIGNLRLYVKNDDLRDVLDGFAHSEMKRKNERFILFKSNRKASKTGRMDNCRTLLFRCGESIGVTGRGLQWGDMCDEAGIVAPLVWDYDKPNFDYPVIPVPFNRYIETSLMMAYCDYVKEFKRQTNKTDNDASEAGR